MEDVETLVEIPAGVIVPAMILMIVVPTMLKCALVSITAWHPLGARLWSTMVGLSCFRKGPFCSLSHFGLP